MNFRISVIDDSVYCRHPASISSALLSFLCKSAAIIAGCITVNVDIDVCVIDELTSTALTRANITHFQNGINEMRQTGKPERMNNAT